MKTQLLVGCQATEDRLPKQSRYAVLDIFACAILHDIFASNRSQSQNFIEFPVE